MDKLCISAERLDSEEIQLLLKQILPTYTPRNFGPQLSDRANLPGLSIKAEA